MTTPAQQPARVPDKPNTYWWRQFRDEIYAVEIVGEFDGLSYQVAGHEGYFSVKNDGYWLCECLPPAEQARRLVELQTAADANATDPTIFDNLDEVIAYKRGVIHAATALGITLPEGREG